MTKKALLRWSLTALSCVLLSVGFSSCKNNDDTYTKPTYSITKDGKADKTFSLAKEGGTLTLHLETNRRWEVSSTADWVSINPTSGEAGVLDITVRVLPNSTAQARRAQIIFKISGITEIYTIEQTSGDTPGGGGNQGAETALADFIKKYDQGKEVTVDEEIILKASLITDIESNNFATNRNIILQAGEVGITVRLKSAANKAWKPGTVFAIKAKGGKVSRYKEGSLQLDMSAVADEAAVTATSEVITIQPKTVTLADIYAGKYDNILIAVDGIQFQTPGKALNPNKSVGGKAPSPYFNNLTDCVTATPQGVSILSAPISGHAPEALRSAITPDKNGRIVGIIQTSVSEKENVKTRYYNLWIRNLQDLDGLKGTRCTENNGGTPNPPTPPTPNPEPPTPPTPNPPTPPAPGTADLMIVVYAEGTSYEKYIQLYNPTDQEIDLSAYTLVMQLYTSDGHTDKAGKPHDLKLKGKIPAKGFMIYQHTDAQKYTQGIKDKSVINFNGNDPLALKKGDNIIDVIGSYPNIWLNGNVGAGKDVFLHRKIEINAPATTFDANQWESTSIGKANENKLVELIEKYFNKR
ncbi:BACON domain-containing carbohydrate-binding protein [uncultured Porphyromonas sp.]|uniref:lamin tail domain-containing protein n=1 Tax=uncultured Porphyromonas sp. TaxID=159274 RepID=UPI00261B116C|nr:BACON domain-containing carbohydrate-binding protein [uncultured Porphyromonas sp.]